MRVVKVVASSCVTIAIMVAIFLFSAQSGGESGSLSESVARMLASIFVGGFDGMDPDVQASIIAQMSWPIRKTAHATEYAILAASLVMTCWQIISWRRERKARDYSPEQRVTRVGAIAFAIAVFYACTDEMHQLFIDGRAGQVTDVLVDASGAAVGCVLCCVVIYAFLRRHRALA